MPISYHDLLAALAEEIGLKAESLIATEEVVIDDLPISMQLEGEGENAEVVLCSLLGTVPQERWPEIARTMLLANHLWTGTGGATLGLLADDDTASLSVRRLLRDLNADKLAVLLAKTADIGLAWQDFIAHNPYKHNEPVFLDAAASLRA